MVRFWNIRLWLFALGLILLGMSFTNLLEIDLPCTTPALACIPTPEPTPTPIPTPTPTPAFTPFWTNFPVVEKYDVKSADDDVTITDKTLQVPFTAGRSASSYVKGQTLANWHVGNGENWVRDLDVDAHVYMEHWELVSWCTDYGQRNGYETPQNGWTKWAEPTENKVNDEEIYNVSLEWEDGPQVGSYYVNVPETNDPGALKTATVIPIRVDMFPMDGSAITNYYPITYWATPSPSPVGGVLNYRWRATGSMRLLGDEDQPIELREGQDLTRVRVIDYSDGPGNVTCEVSFHKYPENGPPAYNILASSTGTKDCKDRIIDSYQFWGGSQYGTPTRDDLIGEDDYYLRHYQYLNYCIPFAVAKCHEPGNSDNCCCNEHTWDRTFGQLYIAVNILYENIYGYPINICNSAYRCPVHNRRVGSTSSNHTSGQAFDFHGNSSQNWDFSIIGSQIADPARIRLYPTENEEPSKALTTLLNENATETYLGDVWNGSFHDGYVHGHMDTSNP